MAFEIGDLLVQMRRRAGGGCGFGRGDSFSQAHRLCLVGDRYSVVTFGFSIIGLSSAAARPVRPEATYRFAPNNGQGRYNRQLRPLPSRLGARTHSRIGHCMDAGADCTGPLGAGREFQAPRPGIRGQSAARCGGQSTPSLSHDHPGDYVHHSDGAKRSAAGSVMPKRAAGPRLGRSAGSGRKENRFANRRTG
jgi:hypothetical protein